MNIVINNNTSSEIAVEYGELDGQYTKQPYSIGSGGAKGEIYVSDNP